MPFVLAKRSHSGRARWALVVMQVLARDADRLDEGAPFRERVRARDMRPDVRQAVEAFGDDLVWAEKEEAWCLVRPYARQRAGYSIT